jgi:glycosyltransferase involved in cell wall biosynthesis
VAVIVPFAGGTSDAGRTLAAMERLRTAPGDELILADNTDQGVAAMEAGGSRVRVVPAPVERSSYHARNAGAEAAAAAEWLLFMDADCLPEPDLLDRYFAAPIASACGILAGAVRPAHGQDALIARYARSRTHISEEPQVNSAFRPAGITPNLLLRRRAFDAVGGFHEGLRSGADVEICWRIQDAGWSLEHRPGAPVEHRHVETLAALGRQCRRHASGRAWLNRRYPGAAPRPPLTRRFIHALGGTAYRAVRGQGERALFRLVDAWWDCVDSGGYLLGNRAERAAPLPADGGRVPVLVLCDAFPALSETFVAAEARELAALGHRVRFESGARPERPDRGPTREFGPRQLEDDGIAAKLAATARLCARHPLRCLRDLRDRRRWAAEEDPWPLRSLAPAALRIRAEGDRHIHAHFAEGAALNALRLGRLLGIPYSVTAHAYDIYKDPRNLPEKLRRASFATTGCAYNLAHLRSLVPSADAERIHEVVMGVDGEAFRRGTQHPAGRHVVAVGRLVEKKGFADLLGAAALLAERGEPLAALTIVGDGPLRPELEGLIAERGLEEVAALPGWREPDQVRELLERADLLAMPSVIAADGDRDSMPVVVKEALAMEVPVVATNEVGLPEIVGEEWGRLVQPRDAAALAGAIAELLALPPARRAAMGAAGREHVLARADVRAEAAKLSGLIEQAALPGGRPSAVP